MKTYVFYDQLRHWVKIGRSTNVGKRHSSIRAASGADLTLIGTVDGDIEGVLHSECRASRIRGEWFEITDAVRQSVRDYFGKELPTVIRAPIHDRYTRLRDSLDALESEWGMPLDPPEMSWFENVEYWLAENGQATTEDGVLVPDPAAQAVSLLYLDWPHRIVAVGGSPGDHALAIVLADDQPPSRRFDETLLAAFVAIDAEVEFLIGVASSPARMWGEAA